MKQIQHAWCSRFEVAKDDYIFIYEDEGGYRADLLCVLRRIFGMLPQTC